MRLEDIQAEIDVDSKIDDTQLDSAALRIPELHNKYYKIFIEEIRTLKAYESEHRAVRKSRTDYYLGRATDEEYKQEPLNQKCLRQDVDLYLDSDERLSKLRFKAEMQKVKVEMVENFIKTLNNRNYLITNAINWRRFQHGD